MISVTFDEIQRDPLRGCLKSQRGPQAIPVESDNLRRIQDFGALLAANYTWDNPFQTTSEREDCVNS